MPYTQPAATGTGSSGSGIPVAVAGGTPDAITATFVPAITLADKTLCAIRASGANTLTNPTFNPNGLGALTIVKRGGAALIAGDIPAALAIVFLQYDLANTRWELVTYSDAAALAAAVQSGAITDGVSKAPTHNDLYDLYIDILQGDTSPQLRGNLDLNKKGILWTALADDHTWTGDHESCVAGEITEFGKVYYFKPADSKWWQTDANASATCDGRLRMATEAVAANANFVGLIRGYIRDDSRFNFTINAKQFVSAAATGAIVETAPAGSGDRMRVVGFGVTADILELNPSPDSVGIV
jgi:hypothetical protein